MGRKTNPFIPGLRVREEATATGECMRCGTRASGVALERLATLRAKDVALEAEFAGDDLPVD